MLERFNIHKEIHEVYLHRFLFVLALEAITVFLPFYVYQITGSLVMSMVFFLVYNGIRVFTSLPIAFLTSKIGYKKTALLSAPLSLIFYNLMRTLQNPTAFMFFIAGVGGIGLNMYWIGMNSEISTSSHEGKRDRETGIVYAVPIVASIISPYIGGLISNAYGFNTLFITVIVLIAISFVPFFFSFEHFDGMKYSLKKFFTRKHAKDFMTYWIQGVQFSGFFEIWPLYIGVVITGTLNLGAVGSLRAIGGAIASLLLGKLMTRNNRMSFLNAGVVGFAISWALMSFVTTTWMAFAVSVLNGMMMRTTEIPIFSGIIGIAESEDRLEYFAFRELAISAGRATINSLMALLFYFAGKTTGFQIGFMALAVTTVFLIPLTRKLKIDYF